MRRWVRAAVVVALIGVAAVVLLPRSVEWRKLVRSRASIRSPVPTYSALTGYRSRLNRQLRTDKWGV